MEATAYAALVSVFHVINRIQNPYCPIPFQVESQIQFLSDKVSFLIDFLEKNDAQRRSKPREILESRIVDAAYDAEDLIESFVVQQILAKSRRGSHFSQYVPKRIRNLDFIKKRVMRKEEVMNAEDILERGRAYVSLYQDLDKTIHELDCIIEEIMKAEEGEFKENHLPKSSTFLVGPSMASGGKYAMVGFDEDLLLLMDMLRSDQSSRQIIPVVGMGGAGKTTLALNAFNHPGIVNCFDVRAWVTVSQDYNKKEILLSLLRDITKVNEKSQMENEELGDQLYKYLVGRKYFITLDDIWSIAVWHEIKRFFPGNDNGSRVLLTTRISSVANDIGSCSPYQMKFLDDHKSWELLSSIVFSQEAYPPELEELGKEILRSCKGLPLAIIVISGLLKVSHKRQEFWENVVENITSIINNENDESCLKVLALSYNYLPIHLKPCFLYMSIFKEDSIIRTSKLIKLWVAEGFLKPSTTTKTLEEVAFEYLHDLVDRNLLMVGKRGSRGEIKHITIHDLLRDFCLREAQERSFVSVIQKHMPSLPQGTKTVRRFVINDSPGTRRYDANNARSLIFNSEGRSLSFSPGCLLRILSGIHDYSLHKCVKLINSRYMDFGYNSRLSGVTISSSISLLWNLETINVHPSYDSFRRTLLTLPSEIWNMPHLRHLKIHPRVHLPDPVDAQIRRNCILNNLQTLSVISNFSFSDKALAMIPNLKKLKLYFTEKSFRQLLSSTRPFKNLLCCHQLETLRCQFRFTFFGWAKSFSIETLSFPPTLRSLTLSFSHIPWENMTLIGSLPNLEVLKLKTYAFCGEEWNTIEGEFESLKCLSIDICYLVTWNAESSHFPSLQHLILASMLFLEEIPGGIGEIASLESIVVKGRCQKSVVMSAKKLQKERRDLLGDDDFLIQVFVDSDSLKHELQSLADDKFQIGGSW